jgi:radical SAM superfamily enzyme YgiQ (UPF0313 family)
MKMQLVNALLGGDFSALDIAITNLATFLNERTKHTGTILDLTFHTNHWEEHLKRGIKKDKPDIIGMSCNTMYMQYVKRIAKEIKEKYDIPIIVGGYHASIYPQETLNIPEIDAVCIGDGEFALTEFLDRFEKGKSVKGLNGIWAKENGKQIKNPGGCFIKNIDQFPIPNWDLWEDLDKYFYYLGMLYIIGTRGCPYKCTYCDAHGIAKAVNGPYFRFRDPVAYAQEIAYQWSKYRKKGMRLAQLFDQVLTINKDWLEKFCREYRSLGIADKYRYSAFSRIDNLDKEKIEMLSKSGCALLRVGIEAGDTFIRNKIYRKNITTENIKKIVKMCKDNGIGLTAFYILGGPAETRKTINRTINLALDLDANRSAFFVFKPFTEEGKKLIIQYGGVIDEERWQEADNITFDAVVKLKDLSPREVEALQYKAYFLTFGRRLLRMIARQKLRYFTNFTTYMSRGLKDGLDPHYLIPYYHIYGYDNVDK